MGLTSYCFGEQYDGRHPQTQKSPPAMKLAGDKQLSGFCGRFLMNGLPLGAFSRQAALPARFCASLSEFPTS
jgi:hypothetical protein